ncbi:uncharacterized protein [Diadema setosum]|uniref:uncharacterized protein n=1 Tax=Diadema setosum TaxID=31175 RepID=UPI003B3AACFA
MYFADRNLTVHDRGSRVRVLQLGDVNDNPLSSLRLLTRNGQEREEESCDVVKQIDRSRKGIFQCKVLTISRKRRKVQHMYHLNNAPLEFVESVKYLGVTITSDLKWTQHINNTVSKANIVLAFLRRNLRIKSSDIKATAYKTLVRPIVEYASTVCDPSSKNLIHKVEMVQRRAARFTLNRYHNTSSVTKMLQELDWTTLEQRRENDRLIMMYKIHNNLTPLSAHVYSIKQVTQLTRASQPHSYQVPYSRTESHHHSLRTVRNWNSLSSQIVSAPSVGSFRNRLTVDHSG